MSKEPTTSKRLSLDEALLPLDDPSRIQELRYRAFEFFQELDAYLDVVGALCAENPLASLFVQFAYPRNLYKGKGEPHDRWGSFFLLAISQHLRSIKHNKPQHDLVYTLFRGIRNDAKNIGVPKHNVMGRIKKLKEDHPHWQNSLDVLASEYRNHPAFSPKLKVGHGK